jgi:hypothetical protein
MVIIAALGREQIGDSPLQHLLVDHCASGNQLARSSRRKTSTTNRARRCEDYRRRGAVSLLTLDEVRAADKRGLRPLVAALASSPPVASLGLTNRTPTT